jgi:hypothetical protein
MPGRKTRIPAGAPREEAVLSALRIGCTRRAAAAVADISEDTFARMLADAGFADAVRKAEGAAEATYSAIVSEAATKSWQAAAWWLERRKYEDFGRHERVDVTFDTRKEAERLAAELGLDVETVMAEAEAILRS